MAIICHGQGDLNNDGCCYVNGSPCPLRWKIVGGHIFDYRGNDLGEVNAYIDSNVQNGAARNRAKAMAQGLVYACRAAIEVIIANGSLLNNRAAFENAWNNHADYLALVRPHWVALEQANGLSTGSYNCSTWRGTVRPQCCFAEDATTNAAKAANLSGTAVTIRTAGGA